MIDNLLFSRFEVSGFCFFHFLFKAFSWSSQCTSALFFDLCISWRRTYTEGKTVKNVFSNKEFACSYVRPVTLVHNFLFLTGSTCVHVCRHVWTFLAKTLIVFKKWSKREISRTWKSNLKPHKNINFYFSYRLPIFNSQVKTHPTSATTSIRRHFTHDIKGTKSSTAIFGKAHPFHDNSITSKSMMHCMHSSEGAPCGSEVTDDAI